MCLIFALENSNLSSFAHSPEIFNMKDFVIKVTKKKDPKLASQHQRVLHDNNGLLFCSICNISIDHARECVSDIVAY